MSIFDLRLESDRLLLRPTSVDDFLPFMAFCGDEQVMQHLGGVQPPAVAWRTLATITGSWQLLGYSMFSVLEKDSGQWVGRVGPWQPQGWPGTEVGWGIRADRWGHGYAAEAARICVDWAFDVLGWEEVIHVIAPADQASKTIAAQLGSQFWRTGNLPPPYDANAIEIWGQSQQAWRCRR